MRAQRVNENFAEKVSAKNPRRQSKPERVTVCKFNEPLGRWPPVWSPQKRGLGLLTSV